MEFSSGGRSWLLGQIDKGFWALVTLFKGYIFQAKDCNLVTILSSLLERNPFDREVDEKLLEWTWEVAFNSSQSFADTTTTTNLKYAIDILHMLGRKLLQTKDHLMRYSIDITEELGFGSWIYKS